MRTRAVGVHARSIRLVLQENNNDLKSFTMNSFCILLRHFCFANFLLSVSSQASFTQRLWVALQALSLVRSSSHHQTFLKFLVTFSVTNEDSGTMREEEGRAFVHKSGAKTVRSSADKKLSRVLSHTSFNNPKGPPLFQSAYLSWRLKSQGKASLDLRR